jgi:hypothetical protein
VPSYSELALRYNGAADKPVASQLHSDTAETELSSPEQTSHTSPPSEPLVLRPTSACHCYLPS